MDIYTYRNSSSCILNGYVLLNAKGSSKVKNKSWEWVKMVNLFYR